MIRGAVYLIDLGQARSHEQCRRRLGLAVSPSEQQLPVVTVIPTQPAIYRPELEVAGRPTRMLIGQIRSIATEHLTGEPVDYLSSN